MGTSSDLRGLRMILFNVVAVAYGGIIQWAEQMGMEIVLVVTTQGPRTRPTPWYREVIALAEAERRDVLSTTRVRRVAQPLIAALAPDLIFSAGFPYRIPPEITAIPRYGAVNLIHHRCPPIAARTRCALSTTVRRLPA